MAAARGPSRAAGDPDDGPALQVLVDLLGRRHALACLWALRGGGLPYPTLVQRLDAPGPLVTQRLRELRDSGLVEVDEGGDYRLTGEGRRLQGVLEPLAGYAGHWAALRPRQRVPRGSADRGRDEP